MAVTCEAYDSDRGGRELLRFSDLIGNPVGDVAEVFDEGHILVVREFGLASPIWAEGRPDDLRGSDHVHAFLHLGADPAEEVRGPVHADPGHLAPADLREGLGEEDPEQRLRIVPPRTLVAEGWEPAVQAQPEEDLVPERVVLREDEGRVDHRRVRVDPLRLQPGMLLPLVGLERHEQLRDRAVVRDHLPVLGRVDVRRHLAAVDEHDDHDALQELLDDGLRRDPRLDELLDVLAGYVVGGERERGERLDPVLFPDVVRKLADDRAKVTEDEAQLRDLLLQGGAGEAGVLHPFVDGRHHVQRGAWGMETEIVSEARPVLDLGRVEEAQKRGLARSSGTYKRTRTQDESLSLETVYNPSRIILGLDSTSPYSPVREAMSSRYPRNARYSCLGYSGSQPESSPRRRRILSARPGGALSVR